MSIVGETPMAELVKDVIGPAIYRTTNKAGKPVEIEVTGADVDEFVSGFREMTKAGYLLSIPREHPQLSDPAGYPVDSADLVAFKSREESRTDAGWVTDVFKDADGKLKAKLDFRDAGEADRLQKDGILVSPQFGPWKDKHGREWNRVLHHIALTPTPVNKDQSKKWERVQVAALSQPVRFSLADQVQMSDDEPESKEKPEVPATPETPAAPAAPDAAAQAKTAKVKAFVSSLASMGIVLPSDFDMTAENALDTILAAVQTYQATKNLVKSEAAEQAAANAPQTQNAGQQPDKPREEKSTITMSTTTPTDPKIVQLSEENTALLGEITTMRRDKYQSRIAAVMNSGRCTKPQADALTALAGTYQFSAASSGQKSELDIRLEVYEALPEGALWSDAEKVAQFSVKEERRGSFFSTTDDPSDADIEKTIAAMHPGLEKKSA
ncbi:MAG: hypothetical protein IT428_19870 [Planctomycetaceae bacterium]|nr:hypothetical protein [Planctomycetaceae bacterium]